MFVWDSGPKDTYSITLYYFLLLARNVIDVCMCVCVCVLDANYTLKCHVYKEMG
jgi:hypothetical protein